MKRVLIALIKIVYPDSKGYDTEAIIEQLNLLNKPISGISKIGLVFSLILIEYLPLLHRFKRFSSLPLKSRVDVIESYERSRLFPLRLAVFILKIQLMLVVYSTKEVENAIGYER